MSKHTQVQLSVTKPKYGGHVQVYVAATSKRLFLGGPTRRPADVDAEIVQQASQGAAYCRELAAEYNAAASDLDASVQRARLRMDQRSRQRESDRQRRTTQARTVGRRHRHRTPRPVSRRVS